MEEEPITDTNFMPFIVRGRASFASHRRSEACRCVLVLIAVYSYHNFISFVRIAAGGSASFGSNNVISVISFARNRRFTG